ncbi:MAG: HAMP domain-containing methyl-accepting chemotaxis protein [Planctomycetota bacterium]|nr:HAMP domain-containing methyl-accepting chemotaxis protein [Planctomycetota bacterium]
MRWTLAKQLYIGFGFTLAVLTTIAAVSWQGLAAGTDTAQTLGRTTTKLAANGEMANAANQLRIGVRRFLMNNDAAERERFSQAYTAFTDAAKRFEAQSPSPEAAERLAQLEKLAAEFRDGFEKIVPIVIERNELINGRFAAAGPALAERLRAARDRAAGAEREALDRATDQFAQAWALAATFLQTRSAELGDAAEKSIEASLASLPGSSRELRASLEQYGADLKHLETLMSKRNQINAALEEQGPKLGKLTGEIAELLSREAEATEASSVAFLSSKKSLATVMSLAGLALGAGCAVFIARRVSKRVAMVEQEVEAIRKSNDLTRRIPTDGGDEVAQIASGVNALLESLHGVVKQVSSSAQSVAAASTEIAASAEQMAAGLSRQEQQTSQVSAAVEELSQSVSEVARKGSDAAKGAQASRDDAGQGGEVVGKTVEEMRAIAAEVSESARAINELGKKSEQIGAIINVINDIADQTNLLALNAAIEAARAGEHGRGFAVVADEVRKLAERTTTATEEVARSIREIQADTGTAVKKIESGSARVSTGVDLARSAGQALERIVGSSSSMASMIEAIAAAAEQQSAASEEIARSVEQINAVTRESNQGAAQAAQAAASLSEQSENLRSLVSRFKT